MLKALEPSSSPLLSSVVGLLLSAPFVPAASRQMAMRRGLLGSRGLLRLSDEVAAAQAQCGPVVALESTIITHGLPWPANLECALSVEAAIRRHGATPATIAILNGVAHVGLSHSELEGLARLGPGEVAKCSRRDLASVLALGKTGSTTVAGTMILASLASIPVFATGGLGGVHRGAFDGDEPSLDVSADLTELGRTPVAVVCAGVKSILDVGRTLEVLETNGVTVATLGQDDFPAFFTRSSGHRSPLRLDTPEACARVFAAASELELQSGMVVAVPNPAPVDHELMERAVLDALAAAAERGVRGKDVTPFLLSEVQRFGKGSTAINPVESNVALIEHNAEVAAKMSLELAVLRGSGAVIAGKGSAAVGREALETEHRGSDAVVVFGGAIVDYVGRAKPGSRLVPGTSNPGASIRRGVGGVGRNVAAALRACAHAALRLPPRQCEEHESASSMDEGTRSGADSDLEVLLCTAVGSDEDGETIARHCKELGLGGSPGAAPDTVTTVDDDRRTATYFALLDGEGEHTLKYVETSESPVFCVIRLCAALADTEVFSAITPEWARATLLEWGKHHDILQLGAVVIDGNIPIDTMNEICVLVGSRRPASSHQAASSLRRSGKGAKFAAQLVVFEPTSVAKAAAAADALREGVHIATPNEDELYAMLASLDGRHMHQSIDTAVAELRDIDAVSVEDAARRVLRAMRPLPTVPRSGEPRMEGTHGLKHLIVTRGSEGVLLASASVSYDGEDEEDLFERTFVVRHIPAVSGVSVVDCTGAGDTLVGAFVWAYVAQNRWSAPKCVEFAVQAAALSVECAAAVPNAEDLAELLTRTLNPV